MQRVRPIAGSTFLVAVLTLSWVLCVASADELFTPTEDSVAGARVFSSKGCARCHAVNGVGGSAAPDLGRIARPRSFYSLAAGLWNHLPLMAPQMRSSPGEKPYMTPNEMSDLIAFLYGPRTSGEKLPGNRVIRGGAGSWFGAKDALPATRWSRREAGFLMESMTAGTGAWPRLTSDEMADLVAYLRIHGYAGH